MANERDFDRPASAGRKDRGWRAGIIAAAVGLAGIMAAPAFADEQLGLQVGGLTCKGEGGWSLIIGSEKTFDCTFVTVGGTLADSYTGTIRRFGLDLGRTGDTALTWAVIGPAGMTGDDFERGSLAGNFVGVGAEATVAMGGGAHALIGGGGKSFTLQPVSVQVETGLSVAAGIERLELEYNGPLN